MQFAVSCGYIFVLKVAVTNGNRFPDLLAAVARWMGGAATWHYFGDRGFLEELLRDYLEDIPQRLESLEQAIADSDADTVRRTAHSIKGASTSLGTETLGELAKLLENNAASGNLVEAQELHQQIVTSFTRLETHLKNEFPEIGKP